MWVITAWQRITPEVTVTVVKKCCISSAIDETDDMLWNMREEDGNVRRMKALTVQMETVTLIGKGTLNMTYFVYYVHKIHSTILSS
jgi:hypothetical protein